MDFGIGVTSGVDAWRVVQRAEALGFSHAWLDAIHPGHRGLSARARVLTEVMTLNRLMSPAAEHAMPDWIRRTALDDILATDFRTLSDEAL